MPNDSAATAQQILRDVIDGKLRGARSGPESIGSVLERTLPVVDAACVELDEPSQKTQPR